MRITTVGATVVLLLCWLAGPGRIAHAQRHGPFVLPEQRQIHVRDPSQLPQMRVPRIPAPTTVSHPQALEVPTWQLTLEEAIRAALANTEVVRVVGGVGGATSSGLTIYDPAISNTTIDQARSRFDPALTVNQSFNQIDSPFATFDPFNPGRSRIDGTARDNYRLDVDLSKVTNGGGVARLGMNTNPTRTRPGVFPLNPSNRSAFELSYSHPLWQGGGRAVNAVPIVLARINTEQSYFRLKDSLQEMVRGVIGAYWAVVFARTNVWARQQQVDQGKAAYDRETARKEAGFGDQGTVAQTRLAYANFKANLIAAKADLLNREATLRNVIGLPPNDQRRMIPLTLPSTARVQPKWQALLELAAERRPDIVELKLVLEADSQLLLQARNRQLPRLDAFALYRWNGLSGIMPNRQALHSDPGQFNDWTMGINFSVPLGLREGRAATRRFDLNVARDRAALQQQLHNTSHILAANMRNLAQFYDQYQAFRETREAARDNLMQQAARFKTGTNIFLNVLAAITDWGNAVSSEAQFLLQYNTEIANLERQTGTILETHGVRLFEERFGAVGPLGKFHPPVPYPQSMRPTESAQRYENGTRPSEESFNLEPPIPLSSPAEEVPPPRPPLPNLTPENGR